MTRADLFWDGETCLLTVRGHAEGAADVCAAVSCLVWTAAGWAKNYARQREIRLADGSAKVRLAGPGAITAARMLRVGLAQLAAARPDQLRYHEVFCRAQPGEDAPPPSDVRPGEPGGLPRAAEAEGSGGRARLQPGSGATRDAEFPRERSSHGRV